MTILAKLAGIGAASLSYVVLLPGVLDLPLLDGSTQLATCDYWFHTDDYASPGNLRGEACLTADGMERAEALTFAYWRQLGSLGWTDHTGGGNALWAYDRARCLQATIALFPGEQPTSDDWNNGSSPVIWIAAHSMKDCDGYYHGSD